MRLIDAEALKEKVKERCKRCIHSWDSRCEVCLFNALLRTIDNAPTVETSKVEHKAYNEGFKDGVEQGIWLSKGQIGENNV